MEDIQLSVWRDCNVKEVSECFWSFEGNDVLFKDLQQASVCQTTSEDMGQTSHGSRSSLFSNNLYFVCLFGFSLSFAAVPEKFCRSPEHF